MDESNTFVASRVSINTLADIETFLSAAQHLKALTIQYNALRSRQSRRELSLATQIECITELLVDKARGSPRIAEMWRATQEELRTLAGDLGTPCTPPSGPCKGGTP
jgi:hypothetical protein